MAHSLHTTSLSESDHKECETTNTEVGTEKKISLSPWITIPATSASRSWDKALQNLYAESSNSCSSQKSQIIQILKK